MSKQEKLKKEKIDIGWRVKGTPFKIQRANEFFEYDDGDRRWVVFDEREPNECLFIKSTITDVMNTLNVFFIAFKYNGFN